MCFAPKLKVGGKLGDVGLWEWVVEGVVEAAGFTMASRGRITSWKPQLSRGLCLEHKYPDTCMSLSRGISVQCSLQFLGTGIYCRASGTRPVLGKFSLWMRPAEEVHITGCVCCDRLAPRQGSKIYNTPMLNIYLMWGCRKERGNTGSEEVQKVDCVSF